MIIQTVDTVWRSQSARELWTQMQSDITAAFKAAYGTPPNQPQAHRQAEVRAWAATAAMRSQAIKLYIDQTTPVVVGLHDDRCAARQGYSCNCASAAFVEPANGR